MCWPLGYHVVDANCSDVAIGCPPLCCRASSFSLSDSCLPPADFCFFCRVAGGLAHRPGSAARPTSCNLKRLPHHRITQLCVGYLNSQSFNRAICLRNSIMRCWRPIVSYSPLLQYLPIPTFQRPYGGKA